MFIKWYIQISWTNHINLLIKEIWKNNCEIDFNRTEIYKSKIRKSLSNKIYR